MRALNIRDIDESYWLAWRDVGYSSSYSAFYVKYVSPSGDVSDYLCGVFSNGYAGSYGYAKGLRPIFHLKSGIKVTGGTGEEGSPYILGT